MMSRLYNRNIIESLFAGIHPLPLSHMNNKVSSILKISISREIKPLIQNDLTRLHTDNPVGVEFNAL